MRRFMFSLLFLFLAFSLKAQLPVTDKGKLVHHEKFSSKFIPSRTISVWMPENYQEDKKYAVLYMHDGQMLFDASITWNQQEWGVDEALDSLISQNKIRNTIVVGIWNIPERRHQEYFPQKPFEQLNKTEKNFVHQSLKSAGRTQETFQPVSDEYLKFIVTELKPFIDSNYATLTNRDNTFVAGSSMGGLISFYALCEYPDVFGGAACLSTHWPGIFDVENNPIPKAFNHYLKQKLPKPGAHKIYFDYGTETLDAMYPPLQKEVDRVVKLLGYTENHWKTFEFKGADHSEKAWKARLQIPLFFLLN
jgi:predicted alpha/beta superfamily hydrolase